MGAKLMIKVAILGWIALEMESRLIEGPKLDICSTIDCSFCDQPRMARDCKSYCTKACKYVFTTTEAQTTTTPKPVKRKDGKKLKSHDDRFRECCEEKETIPEDEECLELCSFSKLNRNDLARAFIQKICPRESTPDILGCASSEQNMKRCCAKKGLVGQYRICQDFCNKDSVPQSVDIKYLDCLGQLDLIRECFEEYMEENPEYEE